MKLELVGHKTNEANISPFTKYDLIDQTPFCFKKLDNILNS